jgi:hypothetical protein
MPNTLLSELKNIFHPVGMEGVISLELANAFNKTRRVVNSAQTEEQLKSSANMIYNFETLFQRKYRKHLDKDLRAELFRCSDRLRELFLERNQIHW